jgi:hypothetical protein
LFFVLAEPLKIHVAMCSLVAVRLLMGIGRLNVFEATRDNFQSDPSLQQAETQKP